jgi:hypothetical protein
MAKLKKYIMLIERMPHAVKDYFDITGKKPIVAICNGSYTIHKNDYYTGNDCSPRIIGQELIAKDNLLIKTGRVNTYYNDINRNTLEVFNIYCELVIIFTLALNQLTSLPSREPSAILQSIDTVEKFCTGGIDTTDNNTSIYSIW